MDTTPSKKDQPAFLPGQAFKNGKFYDFDWYGVTVMRGWPEPLAWRKTRTRPWRMIRPRGWFCFDETDPLFALCEAYPERQRGVNPLRAFCSAIPENVRQIVRRFTDRHWHVMCFLARCGTAALELMEANPALAFCLANNWVFHHPPVSGPMRSARRQLPKTQRKIAEWLGLLGNRSTVRTLRKIHPSAATIPNMLSLRRNLMDKNTAKIIRHLPRIGHQVMDILCHNALMRRVSQRFLLEAAVLPDKPEIFLEDYVNIGWRLQETLRMSEMLMPGLNDQVGFASLSHLHTVHQELISDMERLEVDKYRDVSFPPSPLPGTNTIRAITNPAMLFEEGRVQHNCVASYIDRIVSRECYMYRILEPERATLCLSVQQGKWIILDARASCNRAVRPETQQAINDWMAAARPRRQLLLWDDDPLLENVSLPA